eukprot:scaffold218614_cov35-Tisochrysis_lutea.AAC.2
MTDCRSAARSEGVSSTPLTSTSPASSAGFTPLRPRPRPRSASSLLSPLPLRSPFPPRPRPTRSRPATDCTDCAASMNCSLQSLGFAHAFPTGFAGTTGLGTSEGVGASGGGLVLRAGLPFSTGLEGGSERWASLRGGLWGRSTSSSDLPRPPRPRERPSPSPRPRPRDSTRLPLPPSPSPLPRRGRLSSLVVLSSSDCRGER